MTLRELREREVWTLTETAEKLNVSKQALSFWESGKRRPSPPHIHALAKLYNMTPLAMKEIVDETMKQAS